MYEKLYNKAIEENAEIVCCNYYRVQEEVNKFSPKRFGNQRINKDNVFNKSIYEEKGIYACRSGTAYEYVIDCFNRLWKVW